MEQQIIANGGVQYIPQIAVQYVYLDFDGELTSYNGEILTVDDVEVKDSSLTEERIANIVAELNAKYASQNVSFVTERPENIRYSTIYIGKTSAFDQFGSFAGLAETIDHGNLIKNDNAFVMLDSTASDETIISTISHETDHLLGTLDHGGEWLAAYAKWYDVRPGRNSTGITLKAGDSMTVSQGGTATDTTVGDYSFLDVYGGETNYTTINDGGHMIIFFSGGTANNTTVNSGAMTVADGGTANYTTVNCGAMTVADGGTANNTTIFGDPQNSYDATEMYITNGTANSILVNQNGTVKINSNGIANNVEVNQGTVYISNGGVINNVSVNSGGSVYISDGGASKVSINSGGSVCISNGGRINNVSVNSQGVITVAWGGVVDSVTINPGASINVLSGGTAFNLATVPWGDGRIFVHPEAYVTYANSFDGVYLTKGATLLSHAKNMTEEVVVDSMHIMNLGIASKTTLVSGGTMLISSGGTADATIMNDGFMSICLGGVANNTIVHNGLINISSGGVANETTVNSQGSLTILSGGSANKMFVNSTGAVYISSGGCVSALNLAAGGRLNGFDFAEDAYIDKIKNNTIAVFNNVYISNGGLHISNGGNVNGTWIGNFKSLHVSSGGTANSVNLQAKGTGIVSQGGEANQVELVHLAELYVEGKVNNAVLSGGSAYVSSGGIVDNTLVNSGFLNILEGGRTNNAILADHDAILTVCSGATAYNTTVKPGGRIFYHEGAVIAGINSFAGNIFLTGEVNAANATIDFAVRSSIDNAIINDLSLISGTPNYTVTVADVPKKGTFRLASGAENFNGTITVKNTSGDICGSLNGTTNKLTYDETDFMLIKDSSGLLSLRVREADDVPPTISNVSLIQGNGNYTFVANISVFDNKTATGNLEYQIKYANSLAGLKTAIAISGKSFTFNANEAGKDWYYQIGVTDANRNTAWSEAAQFSVKDVTVPVLNGSPVVRVNEQKVTFSWEAANDNVGVTGYYLTIDGNKYNVSGTSYTIDNLSIGNHTFSLSAYDAAGNESNQSASKSFTVKDVTKPTLNGSPRAKVNGRSVTISWNAASDNVGVAGYYLTVDGNKHTVSGTSYTINNLSGGNHTYSLTAFDAAGNISAKSADQSFTVIGTANVNFYSPAGWSDSFVLSTVPNTHSGELQISAGKDLYVDWAVRNSGDAVANNITVSLALDGVTVKTWATSANINQTVSNLDYQIDSSKLSAGKHQLTLTLNDGKNSISKDKSITVTAPVQSPNSEFRLTGNEYAFVSVSGLTANDFVYTVTTTGERHDYIYTDNKNLIYDAEKTGINSTNPHTVYEMCCWAATATNMYIKAGYGKSGSQTFANEDDLLKYIIEHADTVPCKTASHNYMDGAFTDIGFEWLFTGNFDVSKCGGSWDISGGGFYKKTIDASNMDQYFLYAQDILGYSNYYNAPAAITNMPGKNLSHDMFLYADQCLRENYSVGLNVSWDVFENTTGRFVGRDGGHAITVYGFTYDQTKDKNNDPGYYTGLIVADSDDDKTKSDPTSVPDRLKILPLEWNQTYQRYIFENYGEYKYSNGFTRKGVIDGMDFLAPCTENSFAVNGSSGNNEYSWSLERTPSDLTFGCSGNWGQHSFSVGNSKETALAGGKQHLVADKNIYLALELANLAGTANSSFVIEVQVYDIYSNVVITKTITVDGFSSNYTSNDIVLDLGKLPLGFYTATVVIDPQETLNESDTDNNVLFAYIGTVHIPSSSAQNTIVENTTMTSHTVASNRYCYVKTNGILDTSTVSANGVLYIQDNGLAKNLTVKEKGQAFVEFGADAQDITIEAKGIVTVEYGNVDGAAVKGVLFIDKDAYGKNITIYENGGLNVDYNGSIVNVENHGTIYVVEDGNSRNVINKGTAYMAIGSESPLTPAEAADSYFYDESKQHVVSWGTAQNNFFYDSAQQYVAGKEAVAKNNIFYAGRQSVAKAGCVYDTVLQGQGVTQEIQDGEAYRTTIRNYSEQFVFEQGCVYDTIIETNGRSIIFKDAVSVNATVKNGGFLWAGSASPDYAKFGAGTIKDATIEYGGSLVLEEGAAIAGTISVAGYLQAKGEVNAVIKSITAQTPTVEIDLSSRSVTDTNAVIDGFDYLNGCNWAVIVNTDQANGIYKLAENASEFTGSISIGSEIENYGLAIVNGSDIAYNGKNFSLDQNNGNLTLTISGEYLTTPVLTGNSKGGVWNNISGDEFIVQYSQNNYTSTLQIETAGNAVDTFGLPAGTYQWRVKGENSEFVNGDNIVSNNSVTPQNFVSDADGNMDLFFANGNGVWESGYAAQHQGVSNGWTGTKKQVILTGKNRISDVFSGSTDANVLVLTDDANGDALFVEDIYTSFGKDAARISRIDEIRAGNGDDIVDMTSQRFAYIGDGVKVYGGLGNDTIWANNGNNALFGDAGNDRLVGGANNDVIVGGIGNDRMHGGGGDDIFTFGNNWGNDTIEQLDGGEITLWFESGEMSNWNADTLTYSDGTNSVKVSGVSNDNIILIFGDDDSSLYDELAAAGCFDDAASEKIFEDKNKGMLA